MLGFIVGSTSSCTIWFIRTYELAGKDKNTLEKQLNQDFLNFDDTDEVTERYSALPHYDEEEEKVSLVSFYNRPI
jgi:hypothetical protein